MLHWRNLYWIRPRSGWPPLGRGILKPIALALVVASTAPGDSQGQEVVPIHGPATCEPCQITTELLVTLGTREGPGRVMRPNAAALDSHGNYLVAHGDGTPHPSQVWIFDSRGGFLQTIGREGDGPGEYRSIRRIDVLQGDTLEIFDQGLRRRTTLAPDFSVHAIQSSFEAAAFVGSAKLSDGMLVLTQHLRSPGRIGFPLQLVDRTGRIVRSFGSVNPEYRPREPVKNWRFVTPNTNGSSVWSVGFGDYLIEQWDSDGVRLRALQRVADWFVPYVLDVAQVTPDGPTPQPQVRLIKHDSSGRLWIVTRRATDNWRGVLRAHPDYSGHPWDLIPLWDTVLEVIDPDSGNLLVSHTLPPGEYSLFLSDDLVVRYREDNYGYPFLDVLRIHLSADQSPFN
jgi:hypothetical protein